MIEKDLARSFGKAFKEWPILIPNNRTAGWPDRAIQLSKSRLIWFELKVLAERKDDTIRIANLDPAQSAWLAKWKRSGGYCHVFVGLIDPSVNRFNKYVMLTINDWTQWIKVPYHPILLSQLDVFNTMDEVYVWFRNRYVPQSPLNKIDVSRKRYRESTRRILDRTDFSD